MCGREAGLDGWDDAGTEGGTMTPERIAELRAPLDTPWERVL